MFAKIKIPGGTLQPQSGTSAGTTYAFTPDGGTAPTATVFARGPGDARWQLYSAGKIPDDAVMMAQRNTVKDL